MAQHLQLHSIGGNVRKHSIQKLYLVHVEAEALSGQMTCSRSDIGLVAGTRIVC